MDSGLAGRTVVITGGSSNIGRAASLAFTREGANVVIASRHIEDCLKVANKANTLGGGRAIAMAADVTKYEDVEKLVEKTMKEFKSIDVLVNSAGGDVKIHPFLEGTPELWNRIIALNYTSVLNCCKTVLPHMIEQKRGSIINISSDAALVGQPAESAYAGCKSALFGFSKSLAKEFGQFGIRINVLCPGISIPVSDEEMGGESQWKIYKFTPELMKLWESVHPLRKLGKGTDVAEAIVFFASDVTAGNITGQVLSIDGGYEISASLPLPSS